MLTDTTGNTSLGNAAASTRDVLIDDTAAIFSNRHLLDNISCARAIDDTAVNYV